MKNEKFNGLSFDNLEKLSRDEQKKVVGGYGYNDGIPNGLNVRYDIQCQCTNLTNTGYNNWTVSGVTYEGCCSGAAARLTCQLNSSGQSCAIGTYAASTC